MLGPVVTERGKYQGYKKAINTVKVVDGKEDPGVIAVRVLDTHAAYKSPVSAANNFDDIMVWQIHSDGFKTSALKGLTVPKITWYWNTNPIVIQIQINLSSADLMPKTGIQDVLGNSQKVYWEIQIDLDVLDFSKM